MNWSVQREATGGDVRKQDSSSAKRRGAGVRSQER